MFARDILTTLTSMMSCPLVAQPHSPETTSSQSFQNLSRSWPSIASWSWLALYLYVYIYTYIHFFTFIRVYIFRNQSLPPQGS